MLLMRHYTPVRVYGVWIKTCYVFVQKYIAADNDICSVSRHEHPNSLRQYHDGPDDEKRFDVSTHLHNHVKKAKLWSM